MTTQRLRLHFAIELHLLNHPSNRVKVEDRQKGAERWKWRRSGFAESALAPEFVSGAQKGAVVVAG
jgi:hypothetical protein